MPTPWYRSRWILTLAIAIALGIGAALATPFVAPVDHFRPLLERFLERSTGYDVEIEAVRLHVFPRVQVQATNVRVKNPQGFPGGDAVVIGAVDLGIAPWALVSRKLEVTYVTLNGVQVNLLHDAAGRTNFSTPRSSISTAKGSTTGSPPALSLGRVGTVTVAGLEISVASVSAGAQAPSSLRLRGLRATMDTVDLGAPQWMKRLMVAADLAGAVLETPQLARSLQFSAGELRIGPSGVQGEFVAALDTIRAQGTVKIASFDPFSVRFSIGIPELDADMLAGVLVNRSAAAVRGPAADSGPERLLATGNVRIGRLLVRSFHASHVSGTLSIYTHTAQVVPFSFAAYAGTVTGTAAISHSTAAVPVVLTARIHGVNLGRVTSAASGTLDADVKLVTTLGRDPKASLTGAGAFVILDGVFPGMEMQVSLAKLAQAFRLNIQGGPTTFSRFAGDFRISQQRVYGTALQLDSEEFDSVAWGSMGFDGTLDFSGTGDLTGRPAPAQSGNTLQRIERSITNLVEKELHDARIRVPFSLTGTVAAPRFTLAGSVVVVEGPRR